MEGAKALLFLYLGVLLNSLRLGFLREPLLHKWNPVRISLVREAFAESFFLEQTKELFNTVKNPLMATLKVSFVCAFKLCVKARN